MTEEAATRQALVESQSQLRAIILALAQDITRRSGLEREVRSQAELIDHAHDAIFVKRLSDSTITFWNPGAERLYGYSRDEALGRVSHDLLRSELPVPLEQAEAELTASGEWAGEIMQLNRHGDMIWVESRWALLRDEDGLPVAALEVNRDVSELRRLESDRVLLVEALERQNRDLRERDRLKDEFLHTVSHELRTPLTAILGFAELLMEDPRYKDRGEVDMIQESARRLSGMIEDILMLTELQAGNLQLGPETTDVAALVRRLADEVRPEAASRGLAVRTSGTRAPALAVADEAAVGHVVRHLLANAIKFTARGTVGARVSREAGCVRVSVTDSGIGVPPSSRRLIFQKFRQVDQSARRRHGGLGIGLTLVRALVELQGGAVGLDDRRGGGSVFWFTLPAAPA